MQSTERQKFEENWKSAFDGAEVTPSDQVWNSIELELAGRESMAMKKRVVFYQRLAAATVLFALMMGGYAFYASYKDGARQPVVKNIEQNEVRPTPKSNTEITPAGKSANSAGVTGTRITEHHSVQQTVLAEEKSTEEQLPRKSDLVAETPEQQGNVTEQPMGEIQEEHRQEIKEEPKKEVTSPILQTAPLVASLDPDEQPEKVEKKKDRAGSTWLAVGAAAGNYSPNSGTATASRADASSGAFSPTYASLDAASNNSNKTRVGTSYSVGMAVGKKFGRFVIQSGVNLNKQQVDYTSSYDSRSQTTNTAKASMSDYNLAESASLTPTAAYTVNSSMEIISIPVQAGYMIIDRKLGWQVNAGVSPDFFLKNTLVDKSGQRERFTQSAGDASPYRSVNWSGLLNTELSYKIGQHYRLSLVPGVRYSFNPLLKEPADSGRPLILDVGFRFRYMFE